MSKELEAWEEVKAYLEYCLELRSSCKAMLYMSTYDFLEPFIENVDKQIKALEIIKKRDCYHFYEIEGIYYISGMSFPKEEYDLLKEVLL